MSPWKCASTASTSWEFQACTQSTANC
jgi:hypothetical protein